MLALRFGDVSNLQDGPRLCNKLGKLIRGLIEKAGLTYTIIFTFPPTLTGPPGAVEVDHVLPGQGVNGRTPDIAEGADIRRSSVECGYHWMCVQW